MLLWNILIFSFSLKPTSMNQMPKKGLVMAADSDTVFAIIASFVNVDIAMADFVLPILLLPIS